MSWRLTRLLITIGFFIMAWGGMAVGAIPPTIWIDGVMQSYEVQPVVENGRTMAPMRAILESLGATVQWDDVTGQATIKKGGLTVVLTLDSPVAMINGQVAQMDVPCKTVNGRIMVPVRFLAETFNCRIDCLPNPYDDTSQIISIWTRQSGDSSGKIYYAGFSQGFYDITGTPRSLSDSFDLQAETLLVTVMTAPEYKGKIEIHWFWVKDGHRYKASCTQTGKAVGSSYQTSVKPTKLGGAGQYEADIVLDDGTTYTLPFSLTQDDVSSPGYGTKDLEGQDYRGYLDTSSGLPQGEGRMVSDFGDAVTGTFIADATGKVEIKQADIELDCGCQGCGEAVLENGVLSVKGFYNDDEYGDVFSGEWIIDKEGNIQMQNGTWFNSDGSTDLVVNGVESHL